MDDFEDTMLTMTHPELSHAHELRQHAYLLHLDGSHLSECIDNYRTAARLIVKVLGERSEKAAENFNDLGCLVEAGQLEAAEVALQKALKFRDDVAAGGLDGGNRCTPPTLLQLT